MSTDLDHPPIPSLPFECGGCDAFPFRTQAELDAHRCDEVLRPLHRYRTTAEAEARTLSRGTHAAYAEAAPATPTSSGKFETVGNGFGGTTTRRIEAPARPRTAGGPSPAQLAKVRELLGERHGMAEVEPIRERLNAARTGGTLTGRVVSQAISDLIAIKRPHHGSSSGPAKRQGAVVPAGRYAIDRGDGLRFYVVDEGKGRWEGYLFVSVQASDDLHRIRNTQEREAILAAIALDPQEAMLRYGRELGRCGHCNRTLTDAESRAYGMGPVCRAK